MIKPILSHEVPQQKWINSQNSEYAAKRIQEVSAIIMKRNEKLYKSLANK